MQCLSVFNNKIYFLKEYENFSYLKIFSISNCFKNNMINIIKHINLNAVLFLKQK
ncbi:hypothetical protein AOR01nite_12230 [Acetobacter orleanensis]|uniref:Uncharacterized protein n=1 Tax=Acetobacter orleanensis TaxID=104099 RepID=A0A4Y3TK93_9PROT|nr:hypothetical protein Abol_015_248 [Acetobacter orleanensis JCM 7639]GEB82746.1 hypothetical protein AOR01nite_12230 [Acetobacter orleanensis]